MSMDRIRSDMKTAEPLSTPTSMRFFVRIVPADDLS